MSRYISAEFELPVVHEKTLEPAPQEFMETLWATLAQKGWIRCGGGVKKPHHNPDVINADVFITTDTGPTIEFAPTPDHSLNKLDSQRMKLMREILSALSGTSYTLLGSGVHPKLPAHTENYYRFRSPRKAYDYAIEQRGWHHHSILHIAATQEVIDIPVADAFRVLRCCHRLTPYMTYLFRNDYDCRNEYDGALSVRPTCWRNHVPDSVVDRFRNDKQRIWMPDVEITSWTQYLNIIWRNSPMFFIGTKHDGPVYLPHHPTFEEYLRGGSQQAVRIHDSSEFSIEPHLDHVEGTDWHYMGSARLRWKLNRDTISVDGLNAVLREGNPAKFDAYIEQGIAHLMIENRSSATAPPGEEITSLAFMVGLLENLEELEEFLFAKPYDAYRELVPRSEYEAYDFDILEALEHLLVIARKGLCSREQGEEKYLAPIRIRLQTRLSPSEVTRALKLEYPSEFAYSTLLYRP